MANARQQKRIAQEDHHDDDERIPKNVVEAAFLFGLL
jgi:hypothetical protein